MPAPQPVACRTLGPAIADAVGLLSSPDDATRRLAKATIQACPREAGPWLVLQVQTGSPAGRLAAADLLRGQVLDPDVMHLLQRVSVADSDPAVRAAAHGALQASR